MQGRFALKEGCFVLKNKWISVITDDNKRRRAQFIGVFLLLGTVAAFMTVLNLSTHKGMLTVVTAVFSVLCFVDFGIVKMSKGKEPGMTIASLRTRSSYAYAESSGS